MKPSSHLWATLLVASLSFLWHPAAAAAEEQPRWRVRAGGMTSDYSKHARDSSISGTAYLDLSGGDGFQIGAEYQQTPRVGWELSAAQLSVDAVSRFGQIRPISFDPLVLREEITVTGTGTIAIRPLALALLFHPLPGRAVDLYMGPTVSLAFFDVDRGLRDRDPEPAYGAKAGANVQIPDTPWALALEIRHLEILHDTLERDLYRNIQLTTATLGVTYGIGSRGKPN